VSSVLIDTGAVSLARWVIARHRSGYIASRCGCGLCTGYDGWRESVRAHENPIHS